MAHWYGPRGDVTPDDQINMWKHLNRKRNDESAPDGSVLCPECWHALEAHNTRGCQVAGDKCHCYQRLTTADIEHERRRHGLRGRFNRWAYRPKSANYGWHREPRTP
jgi:hypothetical protein